MKVYNDIDVYDAAVARMRTIFSKFGNVYFSFSGGKDSSVMVQVANRVATEMGRKFDVLYIDLEGNYKSTRKHVLEIQGLESVGNFYWVCLPLKLRNAVSQKQTHWVCWDDDYRKAGGKWIRTRPKNSVNINNYKNYGWDWFEPYMQFEDFIIQFADWYAKSRSGDAACGVGIRADESLNRFRSIVREDKTKFEDLKWTTLVKDASKNDYSIYNFYPIYDWGVSDIWVAVFRENFFYNTFYEIMYKAGVSIHEARLCQPYGDDQKNGLNQFKFFEPETWGKVLMRVEGANFGNIYAKSTAFGVRKVTKPEGMTWEAYAVFLLESIGAENYDLMEHYYFKIKKFIDWYGKLGEVVIDEGDSKLEASKKVASWRRVCKMLLKNDFYGKSLSFTQTQADDRRLNIILERWNKKL